MLRINLDPSGVKVRDWYLETYPDDDRGSEINPDVTFRDVASALNDLRDPYPILGVADMGISTRCFWKMSGIFQIRLNDIYNILPYCN